MGENEAKVPSNHRQAERRLIALVREGTWSVDAHGGVWRERSRRSGAADRRRVDRILPSGYRLVVASLDGKLVTGCAHRLVWQHFFGNIPDGFVVNHKNGQKSDNRPENLEVCTYSENTLHAYRVGLMDERGERNPAAKLTDHQVAEIRVAYAAGGYTQAQLAERYGVRHQQVSRVVRGERRASQRGPISRENPRGVPTKDPRTGRYLPKGAEVAR